nr:MAG: hypothetical protein [Microvirus sp.]
MKIQGFANRPKATPEVLSKEKKVETAGYQSSSKRIKQMIECGIRLEQSRSDQYDSDNLNDDPPVNPYRRKNLDCTDAYLLLQEAKQTAVNVKKYVDDHRQKRAVTPPVTSITPPATPGGA